MPTNRQARGACELQLRHSFPHAQAPDNSLSSSYTTNDDVWAPNVVLL